MPALNIDLLEVFFSASISPAADGEVTAVRHWMPNDTLGRLPLRSGPRLLRRCLLGRFLAGNRHQHFLLAGRRLARLLGWLPRRLCRCRRASSDALAPRVHQVDDILATRTLFRGIGLPARFWLMRSMRAVSYWSSNLSGSKWPAFWLTSRLAKSSMSLVTLTSWMSSKYSSAERTS